MASDWLSPLVAVLVAVSVAGWLARRVPRVIYTACFVKPIALFGPGATVVCPAGCVCANDPPTVACFAHNMTSIPLELLTGNFTTISFEANLLAELPANLSLAAPSLVQQLMLSQNQISRIAVDAFRFAPLLALLFLDNNQITELLAGVFEFTPRLQQLTMEGNRLTALPVFPPLAFLEKIKFDSNPVLELAAAFLGNVAGSLTSVSLAHLAVRSDGVPAELFRGCTRLTFVQLATNNLETLPNGLFHDAKALTFLGLKVWGVIPQDEKKFTVVDLQENHFSVFPSEVLAPVMGTLKTLYV